jgi:predicted MFS family arabinose efflux permease
MRIPVAWRSGPLAVRSFQLLAGGQFTSTIGDYCYAVALPWLVLSNHGSAILLGTVLACYGVPRMVFIPIGGVLADRIGPRTVMLMADAARCVLVAALAVLAARHTASLAALGPLAALIGAGEGLFLPASFALMPSLLDEEQLAAGNAISTAAVQAGSLLGPALGGALVAVTHASTWAFAIDAASFAVSALTLALIPARAASGSVADAAAGAGGAGGEAGAGAGAGPANGTSADTATGAHAGEGGRGGGVLALLRTSRVLQVLLLVVIAANLASGGEGDVALPALAHARFGAAGYGALLACFAAGGVIGTLAAARTGGLRTPAIFATAMFLVDGTAIALTPYLGGEAGAAAALFVVGATNGLGNVIFLTAMQKWAPPALLGRIMSAIFLCAFGSFPLSVAIAGVLVRHIGPALFFPVAGALVVVTMLVALTQREFREFGAARSGSDDDTPGLLEEERAIVGNTTDRSGLRRQLILRQRWAHANKRPTGGRRRAERPLASSGRRVVLPAGPPGSSRVRRAIGRPCGGCRSGTTRRSSPRRAGRRGSWAPRDRWSRRGGRSRRTGSCPCASARRGSAAPGCGRGRGRSG